LHGPVGSHQWFFPPHAENVFHVNPYATFACVCVSFPLDMSSLKLFSKIRVVFLWNVLDSRRTIMRKFDKSWSTKGKKSWFESSSCDCQ
jgi:hypothetical protein